MSLALDSLKAVGDKANDREAVTKQLLENTKDRAVGPRRLLHRRERRHHAHRLRALRDQGRPADLREGHQGPGGRLIGLAASSQPDGGRVRGTRPLFGIGSRSRELGSRIRHSRAVSAALGGRPGLPLDVRPDRDPADPAGVYGIQDLSDDGNLNRLGNNLVEGLSNGAILALIALGYTLVYGIIELINFAHGEVFMLGRARLGRPLRARSG